MKRFCLWCRKEIAAVRDSSGQDPCERAAEVCEICMQNQNILSDALSDIHPDPILVFEIYAGTYIITRAANERARELLGKDLQEIEQHLMGNVIDCAHALLPEGCGKSSFCAACTLRKAVLDTGLGGPGRFDGPVAVPVHGEGKAAAASLIVTMIRSGGKIILRLNK